VQIEEICGRFPFIGGKEVRTDEAKSSGTASSGNETTNPAARSIAVEGMTCQGCVDTVMSALKAVSGNRLPCREGTQKLKQALPDCRIHHGRMSPRRMIV
jgi:hypothetical protein